MTCCTTRDEHAAAYPLIRREDGRVELLCPHGVGHPSRALTPPAQWQTWMGVHGCDRCCDLAAFAIAESIHCQRVGVPWPLHAAPLSTNDPVNQETPA